MSAHSEARLWSGSLVTNIASPGWFLRIRMSLYGPGPERLILARIGCQKIVQKNNFIQKVFVLIGNKSNDDFQLVPIMIDEEDAALFTPHFSLIFTGVVLSVPHIASGPSITPGEAPGPRSDPGTWLMTSPRPGNTQTSVMILFASHNNIVTAAHCSGMLQCAALRCLVRRGQSGWW